MISKQDVLIITEWGENYFTINHLLNKLCLSSSVIFVTYRPKDY